METDIKNCLAAVNQILAYLNKYEGSSGETFWKDKNGNEFYGDMGYFFEGLYELKYYCEKQSQPPRPTANALEVGACESSD